MSLNKAKVFTVTSVKGGVGKTTTVLNLAGIYSNMGKNVLILDLDLYSSDIASMLNINYKNDLYNLFEDLNNNSFDSIDDYITSYNENIKVLSGLKDPRLSRKINSKVLDLVLYKSSMKYDVILIDTNHILSDINLFALDYSDFILYVINNDS
ncbi:MAG: AAA family ATPase, partial [bacterium]|nr:AAA family ATPase [bacterium]